jgi:hypothetical protein
MRQDYRRIQIIVKSLKFTTRKGECRDIPEAFVMSPGNPRYLKLAFKEDIPP